MSTKKTTLASKLTTFLRGRKTPATLPQILAAKSMSGYSANSIRPLLGFLSPLGTVTARKVMCPITKKERLGYSLATA